MPDAPDTTLRAVELQATVASVRHLQDRSVSLGLRSSLELSKAEAWPLMLLQGELATVLIKPEGIGNDADAVKPQGKAKHGSASQHQRMVIEAIGEANGVAPEKLEAYYQSRMNSNIARLQKELERAQQKDF